MEIYEAGLEGRSLGDVLGLAIPASLDITAYSYDPATGQVTLTWTSTAGANYAIRYSTDLSDWTRAVVASHPGGAGDTTTHTFTLPAEAAAQPALFLRVQQVP